MTPYYKDDWLTVYHGDCKAVMAEMEPESVHCVVTSPPYWGLRDYGEAGQLGLEPTPEEYVANMVAVFREVRRVLRADGTVWLNLGDSYAAGGQGGPPSSKSTLTRHGADGRSPYLDSLTGGGRGVVPGLKPKDLVGIPWRVAFALQADGWYLRSDIIWAKPNPMPESVTDRPTKSHEYLFLLSKSPRYYFDGEAVRLPISPYNDGRVSVAPHGSHVMDEGHRKNEWREYDTIKGANIRSVWTIATAPYPGAHFATFPPKLVEPCIKAGTSEKGVCPECGAPWERVVDRERSTDAPEPAGYLANLHATTPTQTNGVGSRSAVRFPNLMQLSRRGGVPSTTTGWRPFCRHTLDPVAIPATVLDPFAGSGTTGMVAQSLSRRAVLIDLSLDYLGQLMDRNADIPLGLGA